MITFAITKKSKFSESAMVYSVLILEAGNMAEVMCLKLVIFADSLNMT